MNEFDAEKRNDLYHEQEGSSSSHNSDKQGTNAEQGTVAPEAPQGEPIEQPPHESSNYTFIRNGNPSGQEYTTPEGGHGFIYTPESAVQGNGIGRKLVIAICVIGAVMLMMGCCFLGAWALARSGHGNYGEHVGFPTGDTYEVPGTTDGLIIMETDEAEAEGNTENLDPDAGVQEDASGSELMDTPSYPFMDEPAADRATIQKNESKRNDGDGDGKPDLAYDEKGQVITSAGNSTLTVPTVVAKVSASVVEISTETLVQSSWIGQYVTGGAGSGVIIAEEGYIITNHHVIDGADSIVVRLSDGTEFSAVLVGSDEQTDVAILWIDAGDYELTAATLGSSYDLVAGEDVLAIGNPLGSLGGTVTEGIISATERQISVDGNDMTLLQVSAPINPGNSGGGLFNMAGELVGVVNAKMSSEEIEGLGFAIPVDVAYEIACELIEYRYVRGRATTGLTLVDVESIQTAFYYFNSRYTGVYVYESVSDVLQYGDLILSVNGVEVTASEEIAAIVRDMAVGDAVDFVVYRGNKQVAVTLTLMEDIPDYLMEKTPTPSLAP